jgi:predicted small metal-binding protein
MAKTLNCRDVGVDCPYVARGETEEELMADVIKHGKEVHGYTDEQLNDPEMMKKVKSAIREEDCGTCK